MKRSLVLLAGGYLPTNPVQKHLLTHPTTGRYLFEEMMVNLTEPGDSVAIVPSRETANWWSQWAMDAREGVYHDWNISILPEPRKQYVPNASNMKPHMFMSPAYVMTSHIPSWFVSWEVTDIVFAPIDIYFTDYTFVKKMLTEKNAIVVDPNVEIDEYNNYTTDIAVLDTRGKLEKFLVRPSETELNQSFFQSFLHTKHAYTGVLKTTEEDLLDVNRGGGVINMNYGETTKHIMDRIALVRGKTFKPIESNGFVHVTQPSNTAPT